MNKLATAVLLCLLVTSSASAVTCTTVNETEPTKAPGQDYLYVHVTGLVHLLTIDHRDAAWLLLPDVRNPNDYKLKTGTPVVQQAHYGRVLLKTGTVSGASTSGLCLVIRCPSPVDGRTAMPGESLSGWNLKIDTGATSSPVLDPSLSALADIDHLVNDVIRYHDPTTGLTTTPASLAGSPSPDLAARVDLPGGEFYVSQRWKCDGSEDFDFVRWGSIGGSSVNGQVVPGTTQPLAAVLTGRFPIAGSVELEFVDLQTGSAGPTFEIDPVGGVVELIVESSPPTGQCQAKGLHFAGHYFLSGKLDQADHVVVPFPHSSGGGSADDAMCSPSGSDGKP